MKILAVIVFMGSLWVLVINYIEKKSSQYHNAKKAEADAIYEEIMERNGR